MTRRTIRLLPLALALVSACGEGKKPAPPPPTTAAPARTDDAVAEALGSYGVTAAITPAVLAKGGKATLTLEIVMARPDVHVQAEFPLRVSLVPSAGLSIAKHGLGHADAVDPNAKGRRWEVPVAAEAVGRQQIVATIRFALCKETEPLWCVTRNETVPASVEVR